ncbi:hypothetical protein [Micromonospora sp. WMMD1274]|uniref:hypothetical protein n=1 Tax=Micromonospora sp. WMMD1274 TaxID=3404116 RepID=UPI003B93A71A
MILVIGGTGTTGRLVAAKLAAAGRQARVASRRASAEGVRFDWYDRGTHDTALDGATGLYLIAPLGDADPASTMLPFLDLARRAGVRRAVLLSSSAIDAGTPGLGEVQAQLGEMITDLLGRPVRHRAVDEDALTAYHEAHGLAPDYARFLAGLDTAVAAGSEDRVTTTVADVTGRPARTFRDFCRDRLAGAPCAADA